MNRILTLAVLLSMATPAFADTLDCSSDGEGTEMCLMDVGSAAPARANYPSIQKTARGTKASRSKLVLPTDLKGAAADDDVTIGNEDTLAATKTPALTTALSTGDSLRDLEVFLKSSAAQNTDLGNVPTKPLPSKPKPF